MIIAFAIFVAEDSSGSLYKSGASRGRVKPSDSRGVNQLNQSELKKPADASGVRSASWIEALGGGGLGFLMEKKLERCQSDNERGRWTLRKTDGR